MEEVSLTWYRRPYVPHNFDLDVGADAWLVLHTEYYRAIWNRKLRSVNPTRWTRDTAWDGWVKERSEITSNPAYWNRRAIAYRQNRVLLHILQNAVNQHMHQVFGTL